MQPIKVFLLTFVSVIIFYSCDPCRNLDCISSDYYGQFRIVKATDATDLVFGPGRMYDKSKIKFYSLSGADTTFFQFQPVKSPNIGYDSVLEVNFYPQVEMAYMRLSNGDIDTLKISYKTTESRCCGTITEITNFRVNNVVDIPGGKGTQEIRK